LRRWLWLLLREPEPGIAAAGGVEVAEDIHQVELGAQGIAEHVCHITLSVVRGSRGGAAGEAVQSLIEGDIEVTSDDQAGRGQAPEERAELMLEEAPGIVAHGRGIN
jgi:hypothetical protein